MEMRRLAIVIALTLLFLSPATAAEDLSRFGTPVDQVTGAPLKSPSKVARRGDWPADVCAEVQRVERVLIEDVRPIDRGFRRMGLLLLQQLHCGVDISAKIAADQKGYEDAKGQADRDFYENMEAAARSASVPRAAAPIVIQVPQAGGSSLLPDPPSFNCTTTRLGGGMSTTNCR
jgi:hypothetical protein